MITGDNQPGNINTNEIDLNNGGWVIIAILICIIVLLLIVLFIHSYRLYGKIAKLQNEFQKDITNDETEFLLAYRTLDSRDKTIIQNTIKTLTENGHHKEE